MQFKININDNVVCTIDNLTDEQFQNLRTALSEEAERRRVRERQQRADALYNMIVHLCERAENEGFRLVYDGEDFKYNDFRIE